MISSEEIGGMAMLFALDALAQDDETHDFKTTLPIVASNT